MIKLYLIALLALGGCANTIQSYIDYTERAKVQSCLDFKGAMNSSSGLFGSSVAVDGIVATGGAEIADCFFIIRGF